MKFIKSSQELEMSGSCLNHDFVVSSMICLYPRDDVEYNSVPLAVSADTVSLHWTEDHLPYW